MPKNDEILWNRICDAVSPHAQGSGVAFSGGVDSSLVALACASKADTVLLTIGFDGSRDVRFATHIAGEMRMVHHTRLINDTDVTDASALVDRIVGECSMSWRENCIAFYHVASLAASLGLENVITANGIDELFCGYNAYRDVADSAGDITNMIRKKLDNERDMMRAVNDITSHHGVRIVQPLLSDEFIEHAMQIPLEQKIRGSDDLLRKHIIRRVANDRGVPFKAAYSRKKALQYGSGIHASLTHSAKQS